MRFRRDLFITVATVAIASAIRVSLGPVLSDRAAFQLYTLAVMISAWVGGRWSGVATTAVSTGIGIWLFIAPFNQPSIHEARDITQIGLFLGTGIAISLLAGQMHDAHKRAEGGAMEAKRVSEEYSALLESIDEGFEAVDRNFHLTYINSAAASLVRATAGGVAGRTPAEALGREVWNDFPATLNPAVEHQLRQVMEDRTPAASEHFHEASGRWYAVSAYPFRDGISIIFRDVTSRKKTEAARERLIGELREALAKVRTLRGLIPICAGCKKIRNDKGYWEQVEVYIRERSDADFSHGICPECAKHYWKPG